MLPPELELQIFQLAAQSNRREILNIILVAHRVRIWTEPILYESIEFGARGNHNTITKFLRTLDARPAAFFAANVKHISFLLYITPAEVARILGVCTGVTSVTAGPIPFESLEHLRLRRLAICLAFLRGRPQGTFFHLPAFAGVTHLRVYDAAAWGVAPFALLPALTHLALTAYSATEWDAPCVHGLRGLLAECAALQVLVVYLEDSRESEACALRKAVEAVVDSRLVVLALDKEDAACNGWWARAEAVIAQRAVLAAIGGT